MPRLIPPDARLRSREPDATDYAQRDFVNLAATALLLLLALVMAWTIYAFMESEERQRCIDSGRRDCVQIAVPPRGKIVPAR